MNLIYSLLPLKLTKLFSKIWNSISNIGISSSQEDERSLIELYNQMSILTLVTCFILAILSIFFGAPIEYPIITFGISFFYFILLLLNHFQYIYTVRFLVSIISPIWICITHILIGGSFNQGLLIVTVMVITYVTFYKQTIYRYSLMAFAALCYIAALLFTHFRAPILGVIDIPYDDFFTFLMASAWLGKVIYAFFKDREKMISILQTNNAKLKETTEELEQFTYIASHDLKSPLRTINSFIGLIERDMRRENFAALPELMGYVKSGAQQMNTLVEDILEISTLNNPNAKKKTIVDLNEVLVKVQANLMDDINSKNAVVKSEVLPSFYCDEAEFLLLFQNMIQNGIKYNESKVPTINVSSQKSDNQLLIFFKDNGIGIDNEYHDQIFQLFKRLHNSEKYQGTGLGLGLCKKIVSSYGGKIEVDSATGEGSTFKIKLEMETQSN